MTQCKPYPAHDSFQLLCGLGKVGHVCRFAQGLDLDIADQIMQLMTADTAPEKHGSHFRYLMRFIDDDGVDSGQQFAETLLSQHHVGEQQVMVDDHDIGFHRCTSCTDDETVPEIFTLLSETVIDSRGHPWPQGGIFWNLAQPGDVTAPGPVRPGAYLLQVVELLTGEIPPLARRQRQAMKTEIIGPSLQQRRTDRGTQRLPHHWQIIMK